MDVIYDFQCVGIYLGGVIVLYKVIQFGSYYVELYQYVLLQCGGWQFLGVVEYKLCCYCYDKGFDIESGKGIVLWYWMYFYQMFIFYYIDGEVEV